MGAQAVCELTRGNRDGSIPLFEQAHKISGGEDRRLAEIVAGMRSND